jgi:hypothetical protein
VLPGVCVLMQEMVNKDSNRIHLPKYVCRDLSVVATVHTDKIKGVNFKCFESSLLGPKQETGNSTVTLCVSEVQQCRQFEG